MAAESSTPIPPAPTRPSTTALRTAFSTEKRLVATNDGVHSGRMAPQTTPLREAPVAARAWPGPGSTSSMRSEKKRAQKPMVSMTMARMPASGPSPTATTKISAHTRSGTVRRVATRLRAITRITGWGLVLRAQSRAMGRLRITPNTTPTMAIWKVSSMAMAITSQRAKSGGRASPKKVPRFITPRSRRSEWISALEKPLMKKAAKASSRMKAMGEGRSSLGGALFRDDAWFIRFGLQGRLGLIELGQVKVTDLLGGAVEGQAPGAQADQPLAILPGQFDLVQYAEHGHLPLAHHRPEQFHHLAARAGVEAGHRLVGQHDLGVLHQHAGDGHALLLAPGEGVGATRRQMRQADPLQGLHGLLAGVAAGGQGMAGQDAAAAHQAEQHVLQYREDADHVELLEDAADALAQRPQFAAGGRGEIEAGQAEAPRGGALQAGQALHQRRLAAAVVAEDHHAFAGTDVERQPGEGAGPVRIDLGKVVDAQLHGSSISRRGPAGRRIRAPCRTRCRPPGPSRRPGTCRARPGRGSPAAGRRGRS